MNVVGVVFLSAYKPLIVFICAVLVQLVSDPPSCDPHRLRFESDTAQRCRQLASRDRRVPAIIT